MAIGWVAYVVLAHGLTPAAVAPMSDPGLRVIGSVLITFAVTTGLFYFLNVRQPMAYVAAFTAAIGLLPTIQSLLSAAITVLLMAGIQDIRRRYGPNISGTPWLVRKRAFGL